MVHLDPATTDLRARYLSELLSFIELRWGVDEPRRVLDVGCGDLLLARLLPRSWTVDGYDPAAEARAAAARTLRELGASGTVIADPSTLARNRYDLIVVHSVAQYLAGPSELAELLAPLTGALADDPTAGIVLSDLPDHARHRWTDPVDLLGFAARSGRPVHAVASVARLGTGRRGPLLVAPPATVRRAATDVGLRCERLERNLSPLRSRSSYLLEHDG